MHGNKEKFKKRLFIENSGCFIPNETKIILYVLLNEDTTVMPFDLSEHDLWHILRLSSSNRVLYSFSKLLSKYDQAKEIKALAYLCESINCEADKKINTLRKTLKMIFEAFEKRGIRYLVAKTNWYFDYIPNDIDIMVPPSRYREAVEVLKKLQEMDTKHWRSKDDKDLFEGKGFYKTDLHYHFSWLVSTKPFLDQTLAWDNIRTKDMFGIQCPVPDRTFDWMANALNIMFERFYITINAYFTLIDEIALLDVDKIRQQARKYCWAQALERFVSHMNVINRYFECQEMPGKFSCGVPDILNNRIRFPYQFSIMEVVRAYWEQFRDRKIFDYSLMPYNLSYGRFKYFATNGERVGIYGDWFPFSQFRRKYKILKKKNSSQICCGVV